MIIPPPSPWFSPLPARLQPDGEADLRSEESDLRLRNRLHHQRHADRSQSGAPERHEVGLES